MKRLRLLLAALGLSFVVSLVLAPPAAGDNCDIFISPEDCQNTGWTIGVIATLAGGVAVATVASTASTGGSNGDNNRPLRPPTAPTAPALRANVRDRELRAEDIAIRAVPNAPFTAGRPLGGTGRAHSIRLEANRDPGWQAVREVRRGPG